MLGNGKYSNEQNPSSNKAYILVVKGKLKKKELNI